MMRTLCHNHIMYHTIITINKMFLITINKMSIITTQDYTAIVRALSTPLDKTALRFLRLRWLNNNNDNGYNNSSKNNNKHSNHNHERARTLPFASKI